MNPHETLIKIQMVKAQGIKKFTNVPYMLPEDYEELYSWPVILVKAILIEMDHRIRINITSTDVNLCPWCQRFSAYCSKSTRCGYAKRHMACWEHNSDYTRILKEIRHPYSYPYGDLIRLPRVLKKIKCLIKEYMKMEVKYEPK